MTYYEDLGIERSATSSDIKKAYKALAASTHPDKPGGEHEAFIKVQTAYEVLIDADKKSRYDSSTHDQWVRGGGLAYSQENETPRSTQ